MGMPAGQPWFECAMSSNIKEKHYILCALLGTVAVATFFGLRLSGEQRFYHFYYDVPIAAPFSAFVLERSLRFRRSGYVVNTFDAGVVCVALARAFLPVPGYSGHVLFLLYALFISQSKTIRVLCALVLCQVLVVKFAFWNDYTTPLGAAGIASVALLVRAKLSKFQAGAKTLPESPADVG